MGVATITLPNYLGGRFVPAAEGFEDRNPADPDDVVGVVAESSAADVDAAVAAAQEALPAWRARSVLDRGRHLARLAAHLRGRSAEVTALITREQGKPLAEARAEVAKAADYFDYYAGLAPTHAGHLLPSARPDIEVQVRLEAVGVCALVTPWNVPLAIPARKVAPALLCGDTVVLKPSELTPLSAHVLAEAAAATGLPPGVLNLVHGGGAAAGAHLVASLGVDAVSFTGSTATGRAIATAAAARLVPVQLELGGANAAIVCDDADLAIAVDAIAAAAFATSGQQCTATRRVLVARPLLADVTDGLLARIAELRVGPGDDPATTTGPLVSEAHLTAVLASVDDAVGGGATLLGGGRRVPRPGWFMTPCVLAGGAGGRHAREEIFGPVVAVQAFDRDDEALDAANDSPYGLSAAVYTRSLGRARTFVAGLEAGAVAVNLPSAGWEVQVPFGGFKASGAGGKEQGSAALRFFAREKAVQCRSELP